MESLDEMTRSSMLMAGPPRHFAGTGKVVKVVEGTMSGQFKEGSGWGVGQTKGR